MTSELVERGVHFYYSGVRSGILSKRQRGKVGDVTTGRGVDNAEINVDIFDTKTFASQHIFL